jgi:cardiolipin synthase A/B
MHWKFYTSTPDAWEAMLVECEGAKKSIDFEQYVFKSFGQKDGEREVGRRFVDVFVKKAREGVKVRLLVDVRPSWMMAFNATRQELLDAGVDLIIYTASRYRWARIFRKLFRDHRKICIVDSKVGFTGGVIEEEKAKVWRDSWVRFEGSVVTEVQKHFDAAFNELKENNYFRLLEPKTVGQPASPVGGFTVAGSGPQKKNRHILRLILSAIYKAERVIHITSPYFNPTRSLMHAIERARRRGVEVNLLIPENTDNFVADIVTKHFLAHVLKIGVNVYLYKEYVHAKTIVVDGRWSTIGSANFDKLSLKYNYELNVFSDNKEFSQELLAHFQNDITNSKLLTVKEWRKRPFHRKILEALSVLINEVV